MTVFWRRRFSAGASSADKPKSFCHALLLLMASVADIYATILRACVPLQVTGPLGRYRLDTIAYAAPGNPASLFAELLEKFTVVDLKAAGVLRLAGGGDHPAELNPILLTSPILPIRETDGAAPVNLVVDDGCLSGQVLPVTAVASDFRRTDAKGAARTLFLCGSIADAAVLLKLGFLATTTVGLDRLAHSHLNQTCATYGWRRGLARQSSTPVETASGLVLVAWRPASGSPSPPAEFEAVAAHLVRLRRELRIQIPQIACWVITAGDLSRFAFIGQHGKRSELQAELRHSVKKSCRPMFPEIVPKPPRQPTLGHVLLSRTSDRAIWGDAVDDDLRQADADADAAINVVVGRLLDAAGECQEPFRANAMFALATVSMQFHRTAQRVVWPMARGQVPDITTNDEQTGRDFNRLLRLISPMMRLTDLLQRDGQRPAQRPKAAKDR
jgi:hypothetical protein